MKQKIIYIFILALLPLFLINCKRSLNKSISLLKNPKKHDEAVFDIMLSRKSATPKMIKKMNSKWTSDKLKVEIVPILYRLYLREYKDEIIQTLITNLKYTDNEDIRAAVVKNLAAFNKPEITSILFDQLKSENTNILLGALENIQTLLLSGRTNISVEQFKMLKAFSNHNNMNIMQYSYDIRGRYIEEYLMPLAKKYLQAFQTDELEAIYKKAFEIHPNFHGALVPYIHYLYQYKNKSKAIQFAKKHNKIYSIKRASGPIKIDGKLNDVAWKNTKPRPSQYMNLHSYYEKTNAAFPTSLTLLYDNAYLYVGFYGTDDDITNLQVTKAYKKRDGEIWNDDSFEVFLQPRLDDNLIYQFIINSSNYFFDSKVKRGRGGGWNSEFNSDAKTAAYVSVEGNYWSAELRIPLKDMGVSPKPGEVWRGNLARTKTTKESLILNAFPVFGDNWHIQYFGFFLFE